MELTGLALWSLFGPLQRERERVDSQGLLQVGPGRPEGLQKSRPPCWPPSTTDDHRRRPPRASRPLIRRALSRETSPRLTLQTSQLADCWRRRCLCCWRCSPVSQPTLRPSATDGPQMHNILNSQVSSASKWSPEIPKRFIHRPDTSCWPATRTYAVPTAVSTSTAATDVGLHQSHASQSRPEHINNYKSDI